MGKIILPLPPISLKANRVLGQHWGAAYRDKKGYRLACQAAIAAMEWSEDDERYPVHVTVVAYVGKGMHLPDLKDVGTWGKGALDCLVQAGVFKDDSPAYIRPFTADCGRDEENP